MTNVYSDEDGRPIPSTADFWRSLGQNVIPARRGKPIEDWKRWQFEQIPKSKHEVWKYNHSFDSGMMVMLGKSWVNSQYLWVAIPTSSTTTTTPTTNQQCTNRDCNKRIETDSNYCRYCGTKQRYYDDKIDSILINDMLNDPKDPKCTEYQAKTLVAIYSLVHGHRGPPLPVERAFIVCECDEKQYYLYGYCKQPFPDLKLKGFDVRTSGVVFCHPIILPHEINLNHGDTHSVPYECHDYHETIIPFHEFVLGDHNERVFELISNLAQENIKDRPVLVENIGESTSMRPFALLEDWEEANRLIGNSGGGSSNIDVRRITGDYLTSKVREYYQLYPGEIRSSFSGKGRRERISVERLISIYYEHSLGRCQLRLRPYLLGWLKEKVQHRLDWCEYAMSYRDNKETVKCVHESMFKYRKDPDDEGTVNLLAEDIAATKYVLKMIGRSFIIPEQSPIATRDGWKVLLLDRYHIGWLKAFLLYESKSKLDHLSWARSRHNKQKKDRVIYCKRDEIESKCGAAMMDRLLEIIDKLDLNSPSVAKD